MTAYKKILAGKPRPQLNKKDGNNAPRSQAKDFTPANRWVQCWGTDLPRFNVGPDVRLTNGKLTPVMVANCEAANVELVFPATMDYHLIRARVDDKILEIVRLQTALTDGADWQEWEKEGLAIDFDDWMMADS